MKEIVEKAKERIPSIDHILEESCSELKLSEDFIRHDFSAALTSIDLVATENFMRYQRDAVRRLAELWIESQRGVMREVRNTAQPKEPGGVLRGGRQSVR